MVKYDSYKDSGVEWIGEIPKHWIFTRLGFGVDTIVPMRDKPTDLTGIIPWIRIEDRDGKYISKSKTNQGVSLELIKEMNLKVYPIGTVLCTCSCSFGTTMIVKEPLTSNQTFIGLVPLEDKFTSEYLSYLLEVYKDELERLSSGSIQQYLSRDNFKSLKVVFPPLSEQTQIVQYLDTKTNQIDTLIQKTQEKINLLREKRTSLINHTVTKGLNPHVEMKESGVEWIGKIPKHWEIVKLNYLSERIGDGIHSTPEYVDESEFYFINGNNLGDGIIQIYNTTKRVSKDEYEKYFIDLDENTILLSINGTIGNLSFFQGEKVILGKSSCFIKLKKHINKKFIYYLLSSESVQEYFQFELTGTTIFNLSLNSVRKTPILSPPHIEQQQIVEYLDEQTQLIDSLIKKEENRVELLKEYRQSLISDVVTGKIKVTTNE